MTVLRTHGISLNRLNEIVRGKRGITADTAFRLARLLKTSPFSHRRSTPNSQLDSV